MFRAYEINSTGNWDDYLLLIDFAYNNSYPSTIKMTRCKALYERRCISPTSWFEVGEATLIGPDSVEEAMNNAQLITESFRTAHSHHKSYIDVGGRNLSLPLVIWST